MEGAESNSAQGMFAQKLAEGHLIEKGYRTVARNVRRKAAGEIDLVMMDKGWMIFVEVKSRHSDAYGFPETAVNKPKQRMIGKTADIYVREVDHRGEIRFDIVALTYKAGSPPHIEHIRDAFAPAW